VQQAVALPWKSGESLPPLFTVDRQPLNLYR
jgi:hypothetical protein